MPHLYLLRRQTPSGPLAAGPTHRTAAGRRGGPQRRKRDQTVLGALWRLVAILAVERQRHGDEQRHVQAGSLLEQLHVLGRQGGGHIPGPEAQGSNVAVAHRGD
jgi:hypothetical protein